MPLQNLLFECELDMLRIFTQYIQSKETLIDHDGIKDFLCKHINALAMFF